MEETAKLAKAFQLAEWLHRDQFRKRGVDEEDAKQIPYMTHLAEVLALTILGGGDDDQQVAALLHDAIEDQAVTPDGRVTSEVIGEMFGQKALDYVLACTDGDPNALRDASTWSARKAAHIAHLDELASADPSVLLVSIADKLSNGQAIVADVSQHGQIVWNRFNAEPDQIVWYYTSMLEMFKKYLYASHPLLHRYGKVVAEMQQLVR